MSRNENLNQAKAAKDDEFYTRIEDIEKEMTTYLDFDADVFRGKTVLCPCDDPEWSNFTRYFIDNFRSLGLKKLISTCYNKESGKLYFSDLFVEDNDVELPPLPESRGKIFVVDRDNIDNIDIDNLPWEYLQGGGDFRSDEITKLRDEADIIVTNPPFSIFREFFDWIMGGGKLFSIVGTIGCSAYKNIFPHIKERNVRLGASIRGGGTWFRVPDVKTENFITDEEGNSYVQLGFIRWFTNIPCDDIPKKLDLQTMQYNIENNTKLANTDAYKKYDDHDAIEVPYSDAIPSDYDGVMGVPITFLDKWNPEQYEIVSGSKEEPAIEGRNLFGRYFIKRKN